MINYFYHFKYLYMAIVHHKSIKITLKLNLILIYQYCFNFFFFNTIILKYSSNNNSMQNI